MHQPRAGQGPVEARHASVFDGELGILAVSLATWRFNFKVHPIAPVVRGHDGLTPRSARSLFFCNSAREGTEVTVRVVATINAAPGSKQTAVFQGALNPGGPEAR